MKRFPISILLVLLVGMIILGSVGHASAESNLWTGHEPKMDGIPTDVAFGNNVYVAVGENGRVWVSSDSITWQGQTFDQVDFLTVDYGNGLFLAIGVKGTETEMLTSADGLSWKRATAKVAEISKTKWPVLACGGGKFVLVGDSGGIWSSSDGLTWSKCESGTNANLLSTAYGSGLFMAVGEKMTVLSSGDGVVWNKCNIPKKTNTFVEVDLNDQFNCSLVAYIKGRFGVYFRPKPKAQLPQNATQWLLNDCMFSVDGVNWELNKLSDASRRPAQISKSSGGGGIIILDPGHRTDFNHIQRGMAAAPNGVFLYGYLKSADGLSWDLSYMRGVAVCCGDGCFLGVGWADTKSYYKINGEMVFIYPPIVYQSPYLGKSELESLTVGNGKLEPIFDPGCAEYKVLVENKVASMTVTATAAENDSTVILNGTKTAVGSLTQTVNLRVGSTPISIAVKARNGQMKNYKVIVQRSAPVIKPTATKKPVK